MKSLKIMTLNLQNNKTLKFSKTYWQKRVSPICQLIEKENPDLIGTQECSLHMLKTLEEKLPQYQILHNSRQGYEDDNAIFVNKKKLSVQKKGIISLSKTRQTPHSHNLSSAQARTCSYAQVKAGSNTIHFYNTHLDFLSPKERTFQLQVIKNWILENHQEGQSEILVGDFNMNRPKIFQKLEQETGLKNAIRSSFGTTFRPHKKQRPIDHIFLSKELKVEKTYKLGNAYQGLYPSDHYAVLVKIKI